MKIGIIAQAALLATVAANSQVVFDKDQNLYLLGVANKDFAAGAQKDWNSSSSFDKISKGDRPSFDTSNPNCWLSQYFNGAYCLNVEKKDPASVYILDFKAKEWTKASADKAEEGGPNMDNLEAVLDHDTNVWYGLDGSNLFSLEMGEALIPNDTLKWNSVDQVPFNTEDYDPVIGLASNHLHFVDVPGASDGEAHLFVIHYSYFQPEVQKYGDWKQEHGQTASVFKKDNEWQTKFWYIPDSGEQSYLIDVESNTTSTFDGPTVKDSKSDYASTENTLVQLTSTNEVYYLDFSDTDSAKWTQIENTALPIASNNTVTQGDNGDSGAAATVYSYSTASVLLIAALLCVL